MARHVFKLVVSDIPRESEDIERVSRATAQADARGRQYLMLVLALAATTFCAVSNFRVTDAAALTPGFAASVFPPTPSNGNYETNETPERGGECAKIEGTGGPFSFNHYPPWNCEKVGRPYASNGAPFWDTGNEHCVAASRPYSGTEFTWHYVIPHTGYWHVAVYIPEWTQYGFGTRYKESYAGGGVDENEFTQQAYNGELIGLFGDHPFTAGEESTVRLPIADHEDAFCHYQTAGLMQWVYDGPQSPEATISAPPGGGIYYQGELVATTFECTPAFGQGLESCKDQNGESAPHGYLNTSMDGQQSYSVTAKDADGATASSAISYSVAANPTATISHPNTGGIYPQGAIVHTTFECAEGEGGPGLASCIDSNGASGGSGTLNTAAIGSATYTVTATSKDGGEGTGHVNYTVYPVKATCTGDTGTVKYSPGLTGSPAKQKAKVKGSLTGCSGEGFTEVKYSATLETKELSCAFFKSTSGETATGPALFKWSPKVKKLGQSRGMLGLSEAAGASLEDSVIETGPFSPARLWGMVSQELIGGQTCGETVGKKKPKPVKKTKFTGSAVELY